MNLKSLAEPQTLIDAGFARGRKAAGQYGKQKTHFYTLKGQEIAFIDAAGMYFDETLTKVVTNFPSIDKLEPFYYDMFTCIVDVNQSKKSLSSISSVAKILKRLRRESIIRLKEMKYGTGAEDYAKKIRHAYVGRASSLIDGLAKQINYYNDVAKRLRELPRIDIKEECYFLAGYPNVGKSTLMNKITDSKPEIAPYPFTTKGLNVGHLMKKYMPIPVIDTPGLLDRPLHERNKIELKAITAFQHLKGTILFVVDPLDDLDKQKNLFTEMRKLFTNQGVIIIINKTDIAPVEYVDKAKELFKDYSIIIEGNGLNNLKEELLK